MRKSTIFGLTTGLMLAMAGSAVAANPTYVLDPAAGSVVKDLTTISIDFTDTEVFFHENNRMGAAVLENMTTGETYVCQEPTLDTRAMTDGKAYTMTFVNASNDEAEPITTAGEYVLTVRAMYQYVDDEMVDVDPITANYTIEFPVAYTLNPLPGVASNLQGITLNFTDTQVSFYENNRMPAAVLTNLTTGEEYVCEAPDRNTRPTAGVAEYVLMFANVEGDVPEAINTPGEYQLTVRSMYTGVEEEAEDIPAITANYIVNYPVAFTLDPAFGMAVDDLTNITLTFPETKNVDFYENNRMPAAVLVNKTTGSEYVCQEPMMDPRAATEGKAFTLTFVSEENEDASPVNVPGYYELTIRSMYQEVDGEMVDLPMITGNYFINFPVAYDLNPVDGAYVESISTVVLQFPETKNVKFYENNRMPVAVIANLDNGKEYICQEADLNPRAELENGIEYNFTFVDEDDEATVITEPGRYQLTIRSMYLADYGMETDLPVLNATYTIPYPVEYTLNPDNGATVEDLMTVTIQFPNDVVSFYEGNRMPVAVLENTTTGKVYSAQEADRNVRAEEGSEYSFTFIAEDEEDAAAITEPGQYVMTIRAMYIAGEDEEADNIDLPVITANYTIEYPVAYYLNPENGTTVEDLMTVTIQFPNDVVSFYEGNRMPVAVLENTTTGKVYSAQEADRNVRAEEGSEYSFTFIAEDEEDAAAITEPGQYVMTIRAMYIAGEDEEADNIDLPVITANYTIDYPVAYYLNPDNGATVEDLMTVTIQFPNDVVSFYEGNRMPVAVLENTTTGKVYNAQEADRNVRAEEGSEYSFTFVAEDEEDAAAITEPGQYVMTIRAMYIAGEDEEDNIDLPVITANYTIEYPVAYYLNPENGTNVEDLMTVTIQFPNDVVSFYEGNRMPVAVLENTTTGKVYNAQEADRNVRAEEGSEYSFTFIAEDEEDAAAITEPGQYVMTIRAMYIAGEDEEDNIDLPIITANYTISYPVAYYLNPENGANVENLKTVIIEFPENRNVSFYEGNRMAVATLVNTTTGVVYSAQEADRNASAMTEGVEYSFTFIAEDEEEAFDITAPGKYELTIRALYLDNGSEEENVDLPVITANYTISYPVVYYLNPDDGANVEDLMTVSIEFPENKNVSFYENNGMPVAVLVNNTTGAEYACAEAEMADRAMTEGVVYTLTFIAEDAEEAAPITETGNYTLTIRALRIETEEGEYDALPVITANYNIEYPVEYILTPADGSMVEDLSVIGLEFPMNTNVVFDENNRMPVAVLTELGTGDEYICEEADRNTFATTDGIAYEFHFVSFETGMEAVIKEAGTYKLVIRALSLQSGEGEDAEFTALPVIEATYTIATSGAEAIEAIEDATVYNVYTFSGLQLVANGTAADVKNLPAGMYIINGQKVIIRK